MLSFTFDRVTCCTSQREKTGRAAAGRCRLAPLFIGCKIPRPRLRQPSRPHDQSSSGNPARHFALFPAAATPVVSDRGGLRRMEYRLARRCNRCTTDAVAQYNENERAPVAPYGAGERRPLRVAASTPPLRSPPSLWWRIAAGTTGTAPPAQLCPPAARPVRCRLPAAPSPRAALPAVPAPAAPGHRRHG